MIFRSKSDCDGPAWVGYLFDTFGYGITYSYLSPVTAYQFYYKISPLQNSISKISEAISELPLVMVKDDETDVLIKEHPVLELLKAPSPLTTTKRFLDNLATSFMATNEIWVIVRGNVEREPLELVFVHPFNVTINQDAGNIWPLSVQTNLPGERRMYLREEVKGRFRYFDKMKLNEIFPYVAESSDISSVGSFRGVSKLTSLKDELLSYSSSVLNNTASIDNQGRPSGIVSPEKDDFDEDQMDDLTKILKDIQGANKSGRMFVIPAAVKAVFERWSPKDMDFDKLQVAVKKSIWNLFSIPLPIVSDEGQTYSNFSESQTAFYDEAVNPQWAAVSDCLKWILETRYDMQGLSIWYNPFEVPALKRRAIVQMESMHKGNALTTNEIRQSAGFEDIEEGNDVIVLAKNTTLSNIQEGASFDSGS